MRLVARWIGEGVSRARVAPGRVARAVFVPTPFVPTLVALVLLALAPAGPLWAAKPSVAQALGLRPVQADVSHEQPAADDVDKCKLEAERTTLGSGWVVRNDAGRLLRRFLDTNGDNKVDQWCYFQDGLETYRDIDSDFDGKVDQYRWLGSAGVRWGLDPNEDGVVDQWKVISAEEVTAELIAALRDKDAKRFTRLLASAAELDELGLGRSQTQELKARVAQAAVDFAELARQQKVVGEDAVWLHFGANRPGVIPVGMGGATKDVYVYDNVAAVFEAGGQHNQVTVGSLARVGEAWRLIDVPRELAPATAEPPLGLMLQTAVLDATPDAAEGLSGEAQRLIAEYQNLEKQFAGVSGARLTELHDRRADLLEKLIDATTSRTDRETWMRQLADAVFLATQANEYPGGVARLVKLAERVKTDAPSDEIAAHVKFRALMSDYTQSLRAPDADFAKIQQQWLTAAETFIKDHPRAADAAEAMLQLGLAREFAGRDDEARGYYRRIASDFPDAEAAAKAAGAARRLDSVGKALEFRGPALDGKTYDLKDARGKVVLLHYWATWCEPCKQDLETIKQLYGKYRGQGFMPVGVNVDNERRLADGFVSSKGLGWVHYHEAGGLDSRPANELGILTMPTMLLLDKQGRVLHRNIHAAQLEAEIEKALK